MALASAGTVGGAAVTAGGFAAAAVLSAITFRKGDKGDTGDQGIPGEPSNIFFDAALIKYLDAGIYPHLKIHLLRYVNNTSLGYVNNTNVYTIIYE